MPPPSGWPITLGRRHRCLELRVGVDQLVAFDDRWQVGLVGDVEEDGHDAVDEADDVELPDRQRAERVGDRDRRQRRLPGPGRR